MTTPDSREAILSERARRAAKLARDVEQEDWAPQLFELIERAEVIGDADLEHRLRVEVWASTTYPRPAGTPERGARFATYAPELADPANLAMVSDLGHDTALPPLVRAQFLDLVWNLEDGQRAHPRAGLEAADAYLEFDAAIGATPPTLKDDDFGRGFKLVDALARACELARATNQKGGAARVSALIQTRLGQLDSAATYRYALELGYGLLEIERLAPGGLALADGVLERAAAAFAKEGNFHLAREAISLRQRFAELSGLPDRRDALQREIAELYVAEANAKVAAGGGALLAGHFLQQAVDAYQMVPNSATEVATLTTRMDEANRRALGELKTVRGSIEIPTAKVDAFLNQVCAGSHTDALDLIGVEFLLDRQRAYATADAMTTKFVFSALASRTVMTRYGKQVTYHARTPERREHDAFEDAQRTTALMDHFLTQAFTRLRADGLSVAEIIAHLQASGIFTAESLAFVEHGLERIFAGDVVSGIHVVVPQVEATLREMLRRVGVPVVKVEGTIVEAVLLKRLLGLAQQYGVDDKIIFTIEVVLGEQGRGIRHAVAHGWLSPNECTPELAWRIAQLLLALALLRVAPPPSAEAEEPTTVER